MTPVPSTRAARVTRPKAQHHLALQVNFSSFQHFRYPNFSTFQFFHRFSFSASQPFFQRSSFILFMLFTFSTESCSSLALFGHDRYSLGDADIAAWGMADALWCLWCSSDRTAGWIVPMTLLLDAGDDRWLRFALAGCSYCRCFVVLCIWLVCARSYR